MRSLKLTRGFKLQNGKLHQVEGVIKTMVSTGPCTELSSHHPPSPHTSGPPSPPCSSWMTASGILKPEQPSASQVRHGPVKELHGNFKTQETGLRRGWKEEKANRNCGYSQRPSALCSAGPVRTKTLPNLTHAPSHGIKLCFLIPNRERK